MTVYVAPGRVAVTVSTTVVGCTREPELPDVAPPPSTPSSPWPEPPSIGTTEYVARGARSTAERRPVPPKGKAWEARCRKGSAKQSRGSGKPRCIFTSGFALGHRADWSTTGGQTGSCSRNEGKDHEMKARGGKRGKEDNSKTGIHFIEDGDGIFKRLAKCREAGVPRWWVAGWHPGGPGGGCDAALIGLAAGRAPAAEAIVHQPQIIARCGKVSLGTCSSATLAVPRY